MDSEEGAVDLAFGVQLWVLSGVGGKGPFLFADDDGDHLWDGAFSGKIGPAPETDAETGDGQRDSGRKTNLQRQEQVQETVDSGRDPCSEFRHSGGLKILQFRHR